MSNLVAGTYGNKIRVSILDSTGGAYDVSSTDKTVWMYYTIEYPKKSGLFTADAKQMTVLGTGTSGVAEYTFIEGDLVGGEMLVEFEIRTTDTKQRSTEQHTVTVRTTIASTST